MPRRILVFFPHDPTPEQTGGQRHCMEQLRVLRQAGSDIVLASSALTTSTPWSSASVGRLREEVGALAVLHGGAGAFGRAAFNVRRMLRPGTRGWSPPPLGRWWPPSRGLLLLGLRGWFARVTRAVRPDVILVHYVQFDALVGARRSAGPLRIIDTHDVQSLNRARWQSITAHLGSAGRHPLSVDPALLEEMHFARVPARVDSDELRRYDRYDYTIAVSDRDAEVIRSGTRRTKVVVMPMTYEPRWEANEFSAAPVFAASMNPFNVHAYLYFVCRVLPLVREKAPDFEMDVTGSLCDHVAAVPGIRLRGMLPDLTPVYRKARFGVCPDFAGTGQKIKISEAMAHGLAVVAMSEAASMSPLEPGVNGLVAENAPEFARHVVRLWRDQELCRRLGDAARTTIARERSTRQAVERFDALLRSAGV